jgi:hypothetical protein
MCFSIRGSKDKKDSVLGSWKDGFDYLKDDFIPTHFDRLNVTRLHFGRLNAARSANEVPLQNEKTRTKRSRWIMNE